MSQLEDELLAEERAFSNCHRTGGKKITSTEEYNASDRDSALVKEVRAYRTPLVNDTMETSGKVKKEERRDGPGGN